MTLTDNLMIRIKNAAHVIIITDMTHSQQNIFLQNTRPDGVDPMDWAASVALYLAHDAGGIYTAEE